MFTALSEFFYRLTLKHYYLVGAALALLFAFAVYQAQYFKLDASSDALVLENDQDLRYYREVREQYGSDDFLIVTYAPRDSKLFAQDTLDHLGKLRDDLKSLDKITDVTSILDVPLLDGASITSLQAGLKTLADESTDHQKAKKEFQTSPLYKDLILNPEGDTTAMLLSLAPEPHARELLERRGELRRKRSDEGLTQEESTELEQVETEYGALKAELQAENDQNIADVREVLARYQDKAEIHLGGVPMISADMVDFVRDDIRTFGVGVVLFIIVLLAVSFGRPRWIILPTLICAVAVVYMVGLLGFMDWRVTVVSSNFISLMLIITLSLVVHLIVRHRELHQEFPQKSQHELLRETIHSKFTPSAYTAATTVVCFASLMVADIRPVIDFGLMMVCGVIMAFFVTFLAFPAALAPLSPGKVPNERRDVTARINAGFAWLVEHKAGGVWLLFAAIIILAAIGVSRLTVENRFIDYFKPSSEIYQGMLLIDQELGGSTPLDIVLDAPEPSGEYADEEYEDEYSSEDLGPTAGYWFNEFQMDQVHAIHDYLDSLPETGKVLSISTTMRLAQQLNNGKPLGTFTMGVMYRLVPPELKEALLNPYMTPDGDQIRYAIRVIDSDPDLRRDELLQKIRSNLIEKFDLEPAQVHLSGVLVLYNNVMQSLFKSQFLTLFVVFGAIMLMFLLLFRSIKMALIGVLPTFVAAISVLGLMGWIGIPLDIMTITIAAITIGIGVHDTIHYTDRFKLEVQKPGGYQGAVRRSHATVGRAMFYTTVIITLGFSILALSNFKPTIYFGLFTGAAMIFALISNLALLPLLLVRVRPFTSAS